MIIDADLKEISVRTAVASSSAEHVSTGVPIPKATRVAGFSPDEWESFTEEWASSLKKTYVRVARFGGSGDLGIDVVGFWTNTTFDGGWDSIGRLSKYPREIRWLPRMKQDGNFTRR